jgi:anti-anti-sigma factor
MEGTRGGVVVDVPGFSLQVTENGRGPVVRLAGELDLASAGEFRECLHQLGGRTVTLDFSDVTFMDSTAIGVLVGARNRAALTGGEIILHDVQPAQMKVFQIAGLVELLHFDGAGEAHH